MTSNLFIQAQVSADNYCVFGLATCFVREEGEIKEVQVIEPIPSAYLEAMIKGVETSYKKAIALTIGQVLVDDSLQMPPDFPSESQFCEEFVERMLSASRTYQSKPSAQNYLELGTIKEDFNYSIERKRVLNLTNTVSDDDNIKQHSHTHKVL
jgi:hypothetical protein